MRHSEETRRKISEALKGKPSPKKGIKTGKSYWLGKHHSEETKRKISESKKGQTPWNKGKKGIPSPMKGKKTGKHSWNWGKHPSPETLKRLSESHKGQTTWKGRKHTEEAKKKMSKGHKLNPTRYWLGKQRPGVAESSRRTILRLYESGAFPKRTNTLPERMIKEELIKRGLKEGEDFIHQHNLNGKFFVDFYFPKQRIIVECDGDFWHANPAKYSNKPLRPAQKKTLKVDKSKNAYIQKLDNGSWTLIRLWESEIKKDIKASVDKIEKHTTQ